MTALRVTDDTTRAELAEAMAHVLRLAKREMPKVGTAEYPTPWDTRHATLDALLTDWEQAPDHPHLG